MWGWQGARLLAWVRVLPALEPRCEQVRTVANDVAFEQADSHKLVEKSGHGPWIPGADLQADGNRPILCSALSVGKVQKPDERQPSTVGQFEESLVSPNLG